MSDPGAALARLVYATVLWLATPTYLLKLWWRGRAEPGYRRHVAERLGWYGRRQRPEAGVVWVHAVSLGETRAALPLVQALRARQPGLRLLLTHGTATGREAGLALLQPGDVQAWLPWDTPGAVRRFFRHFQPAVGVLMETEVWPVLLHEARRARVPMVLANARLSARSARRGNLFSALLHPAVQQLSLVLAQTTADGQRLGQAGAPAVKVLGNLKFDLTPPAPLVARGQAWRERLARPVVMMASSREGEEPPLLDEWLRLATPRPLLLLVPRHPQRFDEVAALVQARGLRLSRRSGWADQPPDAALDADVWLGDSLGEMPLYYGCADVALLGGSFAPLGGQNLIEAAACGCPVIMGPHTFNFASAAHEAEVVNAAQRVPALPHAVAAAVRLVVSSERNAWVRRALAFAQAHRGAADAMAAAVLQQLPPTQQALPAPAAAVPAPARDDDGGLGAS